MMEALLGPIIEELEKDFFSKLKKRLGQAFDAHVRMLDERGKQLDERGKQLDDCEISLKQREQNLEQRSRQMDERDDTLKQREQQLESRIHNSSIMHAPAAAPTNNVFSIGFLFHGQESPYVGMMSAVKDIPAVKDMFAKSAHILGFDVLKICMQGPLSMFNETSFRHALAFISGLAAVEKLRNEREEILSLCPVMTGMSVGEYTALCAAGVFTFEDGLRLVMLHGEAMEAAGAIMQAAQVTVMGLDKTQLMLLCTEALKVEGGICQISIEWFPHGFTIRGTLGAILVLESLANKAGATQTDVLRNATGMHTPLIDPAREKLDKALDAALPRMNPPKCTVYMNATAAPVKSHTNPKVIVALLKLQLTNPVLWEQSVRAMINDGISEFYELGPSMKFKDMMKHISSKVWENTISVKV